jgi:hypothetical protein
MIRPALATILLTAFALCAGGADPVGAREAAISMVSDRGLGRARTVISEMVSADPPVSSSYQLCYLAELMKLTGDSRATKYYEKAIDADPEDPTLELLFGDYVANFRGPLQPLFGAAEKHLAEARRKLACLGKETDSGRYREVKDQLALAIAKLHERDGLPLVSWISEDANCPKTAGLSLFLSTGVRGGETLADVDVTADVSDLTSAALYSQSLRVSLGPLSPSLLEAFLRTVTPFENRTRLRVRYKGARLDLFFNDHRAGGAYITNPFLLDPTPLSNRDLVLYNPLTLIEYGALVERPFQLFDAVDADITLTYRRVRRTGLIDYHPYDHENINQIEVAGVISRFFGPDKANAEFKFVNQGITPDLAPFQSRGRQIYAGTLRYQAYRFGTGGYGRAFQGTRGIEFYAGVLHDRENYGYAQPAIVDRGNYFAGLTVHALKRKFDLSVQPTWFTSVVPSDRTRDNQQYRTAAYGLYRIVDEERFGPRLPPVEWHSWRLNFVHLTVPFHYDTPQTGLAAFGNYKVGAELSAKWFTTVRGGTTFLGSARYDIQQFNTLNRTFSLFTLGVTMGF